MRLRPLIPLFGALLAWSCASSKDDHADGAIVDGPAVVDTVVEMPDIGTDGGDAEAKDASTLATPQVLATRLSRFLWNLPTPSPELVSQLEVARSPEDVASIAAVMLHDPRARDGVSAFFRWLLRLDDLETQPKSGVTLTSALRASMREEAPSVANHVIFDGADTFDELFTAPYTFMDETLAEHYGVAVSGPGFQQVPFPTTDRVGVLGGAGVLTRYASATAPSWPARRFWMLSDVLTCELYPVAPPAPSIVGTPTDPNISARQQLTDVTKPAMCMQCHVVINPISFAFDSFDFVGRRQVVDVDRPAETAATVPPAGTQEELTFTDQPDLIRQLVNRPGSRRCFARRVLAYAANPNPPSGDSNHGLAERGTAAFNASRTTVQDRFQASGKLSELFISVVRTPAFLDP